MSWHERFREIIVRSRWSRGFKKREAAIAIGCPEQKLWSYEKGETLPTLARFREMCLSYKVSADAALGLRECDDCGETNDQEEIQEGLCPGCRASDAA